MFQEKSKVPNTLLERLDYFLDWQRAKRAIARCLKLKESLLKQVKGDDTPTMVIKVDDLKKAETEIIKHLQMKFFEEEISFLSQKRHPLPGSNISRPRSKFLKRNSPLYKLDPFLDDCGILRVGGRLGLSNFHSDVKNLIILPRKSHVTDLVVKHFHQSCLHKGRGLTLNSIRANDFWIIGCSSAVAYWISKCVLCRKLRSSVQGKKCLFFPQLDWKLRLH